MPKLIAAIFITITILTAQARAQEGRAALNRWEKVYDASTKANLGGRWVDADIALYSDENMDDEGDYQIALVTDVSKFVAETERDLENWVARRQDRCGERWSAGKPLIEFPPGQIRFVLDIELQVWNCGLLGRGEPGRIALEAGRIDVVLNPYIEDGKLQAILASFIVDNRSGISKYLPLEFVAKQIVNSELRKLNDNPKFYRAPQPFHGEKFDYADIRGDQSGDDRVLITATYKAARAQGRTARLVEKIRQNGITQ